MPTLNFHFLIYTDGRAPHAEALKEGELRFEKLPRVPAPSPELELFGPFAAEGHRAISRANAAFLLSGQREVRGPAGDFFSQAQRTVSQLCRGLDGWGLDLLRLWPAPLSEWARVDEDPMAEDLFSVAFFEGPHDSYRAETFGLSKLGQREVALRFKGRHLLDEAIGICGRLADFAIDHGRRVGHEQAMTAGFDRVAFFSGAERDHSAAEFLRLALPEERIALPPPLSIKAFRLGGELQDELTDVLQRAFEQRLVLDELGLAGDSPHQTDQALSCTCAGSSERLLAFRREPESVRDSGWVVCCPERHNFNELASSTLEEIAQRAPRIMRYLALPPGSRVEWNGKDVEVTPGSAGFDDEDEGE